MLDSEVEIIIRYSRRNKALCLQQNKIRVINPYDGCQAPEHLHGVPFEGLLNCNQLSQRWAAKTQPGLILLVPSNALVNYETGQLC